MKEDDIVLKCVVAPTRIGKLFTSGEGHYMVHELLSHGSYKLEEMNGGIFPETWNSVNLRHYFS